MKKEKRNLKRKEYTLSHPAMLCLDHIRTWFQRGPLPPGISSTETQTRETRPLSLPVPAKEGCGVQCQSWGGEMREGPMGCWGTGPSQPIGVWGEGGARVPQSV